MAGAGYKLFNTGDVLTAAQVNTYLMEQTVMVFADAAARTTALTGVVSEGMISYLKDTNAVEVYNGSAWVASDDPNAIQNTIVDAKGDLIAASANDTPARLAVGNNGETLVANSSATVGLSYKADFAAGKNKIINADFRINARKFTSTTSTDTYTFDRWATFCVDGTSTYSAETFTAGTAPVAGYEGVNFLRIASTGQTLAGAATRIHQSIEDVRTFANQTVTISFWAKASSGTPSIALELSQSFGSGGSSAVNTFVAKQAITTTWTRYSATVAVPSISGKTIGSSSLLRCNFWTSAGTDFNSRTSSLGIQTTTIDIWGVQVEAGSVATAFQTATGTLAGELAACQRYYYRQSATDGANFYYYGFGSASTTTNGKIIIQFPVTMRVKPSAVDYSTVVLYDGAATTAVTAVTQSIPTTTNSTLDVTVASGLTQFRPYFLFTDNNAAGYVGFTAEL